MAVGAADDDGAVGLNDDGGGGVKYSADAGGHFAMGAEMLIERTGCLEACQGDVGGTADRCRPGGDQLAVLLHRQAVDDISTAGAETQQHFAPAAKGGIQRTGGGQGGDGEFGSPSPAGI